MGGDVAPFDEFIDRAEGPNRTLAVINRSEPDPVQAMVDELFANQSIAVTDVDVPDDGTDVVALLDGTDVIATSALTALEDTVLFVNSDLYTTGTQGIEDLELPEVITRLDEVPFELRGYPDSPKEKFLLITISRYIEHLAWRTDGGTLRSSFQKLSRIQDERGTNEVYETLSETDTDVHVYGVPNLLPGPEYGLTVHGGYTPAFRSTWFVVYVPETPSERHAALVAIEGEKRNWRGFWTYRTELVREINRHIERTM